MAAVGKHHGFEFRAQISEDLSCTCFEEVLLISTISSGQYLDRRYMQSARREYYPHIDGLRAIAVLSVVAFHFGLPVPGGFVGVDVFFVISGFLITSILRSELIDGTFSIAGFYDRRVRRILPALLAVICVSLLLGWLILLPNDLDQLGREAASAAVGGANLWFWLTTGYFDPAAESRPLLHTWSLGVEEQFYVVWPLLLALSMRLKIVWVTLTVVIFTSFIYSVWLLPLDSSATFYLLPSRAWELAVGATLAFLPSFGRMGLPAALVGLGLVALSFALLTTAAPFPGVNALLPVIGSALVIAGGRSSPTMEVSLGLRPLRFIGLISYSVYLWHWPIAFFSRYFFSWSHIPTGGSWAMLATTLCVAIMSWRFVEIPFRRTNASRGLILTGGAIGIIAVSCIGVIASVNSGFPSRVPDAANKYLSFLKSNNPFTVGPERCFLASQYANASFYNEACLRLDGEGKRVLLIGDSHMADLADGFVHSYPSVRFSLMAASGCLPVKGTKGSTRCRELMLRAFSAETIQKFDFIVLSGRWSAADIDSVRTTVEWLSTLRPVLLVGPTAEFAQPLPTLLAKHSMNPLSTDPSALSSIGQAKAADQDLSQVAIDIGIGYLSILKFHCDVEGERCSILVPDSAVPVMSDKDHFTKEAGRWVFSRINHSCPNLFIVEQHCQP